MNSNLFKRLLLISALTVTPLFQNVQAEAQLDGIKADPTIYNKYKDIVLKSATISGTIDMIDDNYRSDPSTFGQCSDVEVILGKIIGVSYSSGFFRDAEYETVASIRATGDISSGYCAYELNVLFPPKGELYLYANYVYPVVRLSIAPTSDSSGSIRISVGDRLIRNMEVHRVNIY